jgi:hypothetical protein
VAATGVSPATTVAVVMKTATAAKDSRKGTNPLFYALKIWAAGLFFHNIV